MERKQFLKSIGSAAAFAVVFPCLHGCSNDEVSDDEGGNLEVPTGVDFTIDLEASENAALANEGGYVLRNSVVVARNLEGEFVAGSQVCSHQGYDEVRFTSHDGGIFYCDVHDSRFEQDGTPINQVDSAQPRPLKIFNVEQNGNILRIFE
ncbi:MAG: (2Fe-2S)-binding protein [Pseudozobellia sp.]|nr:(2Fe-2S)-binding protein [Pseudozobellia sp.]MBG48661.1 (2Fe-2S)-binding protein [Pseudozobellia sp.]MBG50714.1 (2Fe-2S)-binding protein [Pseudozobellia sp.]|tara:strand:- start:302775 stop:303224 length:450 start_codon:yes stop_codon:yes gene_type:complete